MQSLLAKIKANACAFSSDGNLELGKYLGKGSLGVVNQLSTEQIFALKQINIKDLLYNPKDEEEEYLLLSCCYFEFEYMKKNINNVIRSYNCDYDEKEKVFTFTMDFFSGGDLGTVIEKESLTFEKYYKIFQNIVTGKLYT